VSETPAPPADDEDLVPVSVRLGNVVPPEDPEDWTRPLTWAAAAGMLLGPLVAVLWFVAWPPDRLTLLPGSFILAAATGAGAALTGSTQQGVLRAVTATVGAALFAALAVVIAGALTTPMRQAVEASPTLGQAFGGALAGFGGSVAAAGLAGALAHLRSRGPRALAPAAVAVGVAILLVPVIFGG
jgi:MFS family permease